MKSLVEWATHILFLESKVASTAEYTLDTLFNEAQSKYTTLLNQGLWHPSNKTLEEKTLAMVSNNNHQRNLWVWPSPSLHPTIVPRRRVRKRNPLLLLTSVASLVTPSSGETIYIKTQVFRLLRYYSPALQEYCQRRLGNSKHHTQHDIIIDIAQWASFPLNMFHS